MSYFFYQKTYVEIPQQGMLEEGSQYVFVFFLFFFSADFSEIIPKYRKILPYLESLYCTIKCDVKSM